MSADGQGAPSAAPSALHRLMSSVPWRYLLQKAFLTVLLLWGVVTLIFLLLEISPGSVADKFVGADLPPEMKELVIKKFGLDQPAYVRYFKMMGNLVQGDLGVSLTQERPVTTIILEALPNTILLSSLTLLVLYPFGILLGTFQAIRQGKASDSAVSIISLFFYSMPSFWFALMLQLAAFPLGLPTSGMLDAVQYEYMTPSEQVWDRLMHLLLPGVAMGVASAAGIARYMRSSLLEVVRQDYIRTARAKGLPERTVIGKHALRNALLPIVTLIGLSLPFLVSGSVLVEFVFAWPGMGRLIVDAINQQDTPLLIGCFLLFASIVAIGNLVADLLYAVVDPRIRYS